jgi:gamma-F420-2:alpha-L-glutamate ligase
MKGWILSSRINIPGVLNRMNYDEQTNRGLATKNRNLLFDFSDRQLYLEGQKRGLDVVILLPEEIDFVFNEAGKCQFFLNGEATSTPDFVIPRTGSAINNAALAIYRQLELLGIPILNSSDAMMAAADKLHTHQLLVMHQLPIPKTMFLSNHVNLDSVAAHFSYPLVVKIWPGTNGRGVMLAQDRFNLEDIVSLIRTTNPLANIMIQEYISNSKGRDIRIVTLGGKVLLMAERNALDGGFKSNYARKGSVKLIAEIEEVKAIALKAAQALNLEFAGVDILYDTEGYKICELNSSAGFFTFAGLEIDIAKDLYDYLMNKISKK